LAADLAQRKLRLSSLNMNAAGLAVRDEDELLGFFETTLKIAAGLGAGTVTMPIGPAVPEERWLAEAEKLAQRTRRLAGLGQKLGVRVSLEAPHTGTLAANYMQSARLFELIKHPRVGSTFDTSHGQINDPRPLVEAIAAVGAENSPCPPAGRARRQLRGHAWQGDLRLCPISAGADDSGLRKRFQSGVGRQPSRGGGGGAVRPPVPGDCPGGRTLAARVCGLADPENAG